MYLINSWWVAENVSHEHKLQGKIRVDRSCKVFSWSKVRSRRVFSTCVYVCMSAQTELLLHVYNKGESFQSVDWIQSIQLKIALSFLYKSQDFSQFQSIQLFVTFTLVCINSDVWVILNFFRLFFSPHFSRRYFSRRRKLFFASVFWGTVFLAGEKINQVFFSPARKIARNLDW